MLPQLSIFKIGCLKKFQSFAKIFVFIFYHHILNLEQNVLTIHCKIKPWYLLKVTNNKNTGTRCEMCSKLTIRTPERSQWRRSVLLLTLNMQLLTGIECFKESKFAIVTEIF